MKLLLRWLISAVSLYVAVLIVPGISVEGNAWIAFSIMALILGLVNAVVRPILKLLSCGFIIITLGLFVFVINAASFMLASNIAQNWFGVGFYVDSFGAALLGSIIVSVVSVILSSILIDEKEK
ncbi:MAG: phage holin family protein [Anaerolineaceae bacterium]|nr:phage holin family protein [Anaerolineaceae bacterium]